METEKATSVYNTNPAQTGITCVHCGRRCGTLAGGFARLHGEAMCSKPTEPDRPDCYRNVTVKFHRVRQCVHCMVPGGTTYPSPPRGSFGRLPC